MTVYTLEPQPLPTAGPDLAVFIEAELKQREICFQSLWRLSSIDPSHRLLSFEILPSGTLESASFDLLIAVPIHEPPMVVKELGLPTGWLPADPNTLLVDTGSSLPVYAIGDCNGIPLPGQWKAGVQLWMPKAATIAMREADVVAHQILSHIQSPKPDNCKSFDGVGSCFLEMSRAAALRVEMNFLGSIHPEIRSWLAPEKKLFQAKVRWVEESLGKRLRKASKRGRHSKSKKTV